MAALVASVLPASLDLALENVAVAVRGSEPVDVYYSAWHDPPRTTVPGRRIGAQPGPEL